jgi:hypothetical protein
MRIEGKTFVKMEEGRAIIGSFPISNNPANPIYMMI